MKSWNELTRWEKILLGTFLMVILILVPEMGFLLDAGGIELITAMIFIYVSSVKMYFQNLLAILIYPNIEYKNFLTSATLTTVTFWATSAMLFSAVLFLLMMYFIWKV